MGELIIVAEQLTFPWREQARVCPKCQGKGGEPWLADPKKRRDLDVNARGHIKCSTCGGTGELPPRG